MQHLSDKYDIIAISEHWLWPFEISTLNEVLPGYRGHGCFDKRLSEDTDLTRGCGGVALLWKSSLPVSPVSALRSDRIAAIQVSINYNSSLSIVNVYLPTTDCSSDTYNDYIIELENAISILQSDGPVLVVGDFNAHLGEAGGVRGHGSMNAHGQLLMDLICRTDLYAVSLSHTASGPSILTLVVITTQWLTTVC